LGISSFHSRGKRLLMCVAVTGGNNGSEVKARSLKNEEFRPFSNSRGTDVEARGLKLYDLFLALYFTFHTKKNCTTDSTFCL